MGKRVVGDAQCLRRRPHEADLPALNVNCATAYRKDCKQRVPIGGTAFDMRVYAADGFGAAYGRNAASAAQHTF